MSRPSGAAPRVRVAGNPAPAIPVDYRGKLTALRNTFEFVRGTEGPPPDYVDMNEHIENEYRSVSMTAEGKIVVVLRTGVVTPATDQERVEPQNTPVPAETPKKAGVVTPATDQERVEPQNTPVPAETPKKAKITMRRVAFIDPMTKFPSDEIPPGYHDAGFQEGLRIVWYHDAGFQEGLRIVWRVEGCLVVALAYY
ncbi:hypothetical protein QE152_g23219 [Popillia japonica]|uniref:Uncharacterized protein n=1 Tax=Popillia japonica TaxID=7064 RepID=A0AAW1KHS9_POPJA